MSLSGCGGTSHYACTTGYKGDCHTFFIEAKISLVICLFRILLFEKKMLVAQSCSILCNLTDCSPPGSSVYGLLQARLPEWVARCFFRASSQPRDQTWVSCTAGRFFTIWATREAHNSFSVLSSLLWPLGFSKKSSSDRGCLLDISVVRYCYSGFIVTCW